MAIAGLNLHRAINSTLNALTPVRPITIKIFTGQTHDAEYNVIPNYSDYPAMARIQLENKQNLQHIVALNLSTIYKRFYIQIDYLTGLNRNISSGGDYIQYGTLFYKIVEVLDQFETGWVCVIGSEGTELGS